MVGDGVPPAGSDQASREIAIRQVLNFFDLAPDATYGAIGNDIARLLIPLVGSEAIVEPVSLTGAGLVGPDGAAARDAYDHVIGQVDLERAPGESFAAIRAAVKDGGSAILIDRGREKEEAEEIIAPKTREFSKRLVLNLSQYHLALVLKK